MAKKVSRTIVGRPLTPELLDELGVLKGFVSPPGKFDPDGEWAHTYRVWVCHGYREDGNANQGHLRIVKIPAPDAPNEMTLNVAQHILNDRGQSHVQDASIRCRKDDFASPVSWRLSSSFIGPDGKPKLELEAKEVGRVVGDVVEVGTNKGQFKRPGSSRLASNWSLFEAVGRRPFDKEKCLSFDFLEDLSILREGHCLSYRGKQEREIDGAKMSLHRFQQLGRGTLPVDYWLDDDRRLVMAFTLTRAYILDRDAVRKTEAARAAIEASGGKGKRTNSKGGVSE